MTELSNFPCHVLVLVSSNKVREKFTRRHGNFPQNCRDPKCKLCLEFNACIVDCEWFELNSKVIYRKASKEGIMPLHKRLGREEASGTSGKIFDSSII